MTQRLKQALSNNHTAKWPNTPFCVDIPSGSSEITDGDALFLLKHALSRDVWIDAEILIPKIQKLYILESIKKSKY